MKRETVEETIKKWEDSGFLDGLKGHALETISELYCCKSPQLLEDNVIEDFKKDLREGL